MLHSDDIEMRLEHSDSSVFCEESSGGTPSTADGKMFIDFIPPGIQPIRSGDDVDAIRTSVSK